MANVNTISGNDSRVLSSPFQLELPVTDLYSLIRPTFLRHASKTAIIESDSGRTLTFGDIERWSELIARQLSTLGLSFGDRLVIYSPNCAEYIIALVASFRLATTVVTVNHLSTVDELQHCLSLSDAKLIIAAEANADKALQAANGTSVEVLLVIGKHPQMTSLISMDNNSTNNFPIDTNLQPEASPTVNPTQDVAVIQFSSGTTGLPKAVMLSHINVISIVVPLHRLSCYKPGSDIRVVYQPLSHTYGFGVTCGSLFDAETVVILPRFSLHDYLTAVQKYKISDLTIVPPIAVMMAKSDLSGYDLSRVSKIYCASAPLSRETEAELLANRALSNPSLQIAQAYGLTETSGLISYTTNNSTESVNKSTPPGSCGLLFANTQAKVVDPESGRELGPNEDGEIWARGPTIMLGYRKNKAASAATVDEQGWLHTGDIGHYDNNGFFFVVDRAKELIKYKGYQVAPAELEALILSHPGVADVGVIGILDAVSGELPQAWVVRKPTSASLGEAELIKWVAEKVAPYKRLHGGIKFVNVIPRSPTGKILRRLMRSQVMENNSLKSNL